MKIPITLLAVLIIIAPLQRLLSQARIDTSESIEDNLISRPEIMPKWTKGTNDDLIKHITKEVTYPSDQCLMGTTYLQFTVDKDGRVTQPKIVRSISEAIDCQLLKEIVKCQFIPSQIRGSDIPAKMILPINVDLK